MATLENIGIVVVGQRREIRIDWDTGRHQAVELIDLSAESVWAGLERLARLIRNDIYDGEL